MSTRVAFIGLGAMGEPMAANLLRKGFAIVVVGHRRPEPAQRLRAQGAAVAAAPAAAARASDVVVLMLPSSAEVERVVEGEQGVLGAARPGALVIDCSTSDPASSRRLAGSLRARGVDFVDAPVTRGVQGAQQGKLAFYLGGSAEAIARARPVLEAMGDTFLEMGDTGSGHATKIINQVLSAATVAMVSEALMLGKAQGLDLAALQKALMAGAGSKALESWGPRIVGRQYDSPRVKVGDVCAQMQIADAMADGSSARARRHSRGRGRLSQGREPRPRARRHCGAGGALVARVGLGIMPVIDMRLRPPVGGFLDLLLYTDAARRDRITRMHGFEPAPSARQQSLALLLQEMDAAGVTTGVLPARHSDRLGSVGNDAVMAIVSMHPDRFVGLAAVDPTHRRAACDTIANAARAGFKAINLEPGSYPVPMYVDDRRLYPIYGCCEDVGMPVVIMCGGSAGPDPSYTHPTQVDHVASDFPTLQIIVSHGGWPWVHQVLHVAYRRPNVYICADQYLANMPGMHDYIDAINGYLGDRFLYGSSYPFLPVDACLAWFRGLPIRPELMERVLWRNAAEVLSIRTLPE